jgi:hypothetical protein
MGEDRIGVGAGRTRQPMGARGGGGYQQGCREERERDTWKNNMQNVDRKELFNTMRMKYKKESKIK